MANDLILEYVQPSSHVLDVGCGIGITTEKIASRLKEGYVWACDLSERNIWYARQTVLGKNLRFFVADLLSDFERIRETVNVKLDVVTLVDVIEHLPAESRQRVLCGLSELLTPDGVMVLTYPSPSYQEFLSQHQPSALQPIDEMIEPSQLLLEAKAACLQLRYYSLATAWMKNQYVHCVLGRGNAVSVTSRSPGNGSGRLLALYRKLISAILLPWRRWKYIRRVFGSESTKP